ncbi:MAG TPA: hypothetical protein PKI60_00540 [Oscillospiraceae bacterium]|nr:hypothetical protein [Oscillospiraceae bacterium]
MKFVAWKAQMLGYALGVAKLLAEMSALEDIKIEPEQVRKNASTILTIQTEVEDFLKEIQTHVHSSNQSITE